jgi:hypothetical protein
VLIANHHLPYVKNNIPFNPKNLHTATLFLITLISLAVYFPSSQSEFMLDDYAVVVQNPLIKRPALYPKIFTTDFFDPDKSSVKFKLNYYRPVTLLSFCPGYQLWQLSYL